MIPDIPVRWLLTHQAGLEVLPGPQPPEVLLDWERFCAALAFAAVIGGVSLLSLALFYLVTRRHTSGQP